MTEAQRAEVIDFLMGVIRGTGSFTEKYTAADLLFRMSLTGQQ